jgi:hypothetical protein
MSANLRISQRFVITTITVFTFIGLIAPCRLQAQASNATIVGTVTDSSGAAISGAAILVKNIGTGITQNTTSDQQGRFRVSDLAIGEYEIQSSNPGFQTVVHKGITLTVGSSPVVDFVLPVGQAQQTITVEAEVSQLHAAPDAGSRGDPNPPWVAGRGQYVLRQRSEIFHRRVAAVRPGILARQSGPH